MASGGNLQASAQGADAPVLGSVPSAASSQAAAQPAAKGAMRSADPPVLGSVSSAASGQAAAEPAAKGATQSAVAPVLGTVGGGSGGNANAPVLGSVPAAAGLAKTAAAAPPDLSFLQVTRALCRAAENWKCC